MIITNILNSHSLEVGSVFRPHSSRIFPASVNATFIYNKCAAYFCSTFKSKQNISSDATSGYQSKNIL